MAFTSSIPAFAPETEQSLSLLLNLIQQNPEGFYYQYFLKHGLEVEKWKVEHFKSLPFTTKNDLLEDRASKPPFGTNFTDSFAKYTRFCQTSGTSTGVPMAVLDTPESWRSLLRCWSKVYQFAGVTKEDRIFFAFSFGPFLGFWTAFEAASSHYLSIPGGGLSSKARLEVMARYGVTVLCCTPTYALRLGELIGKPSYPEQEALKVQKILVAGEPGGSIPATRARLQSLWGKEVQIFDHHGMTEVGCVSYEDPAYPNHLCILEDSFLAEILDTEGNEVEEGQVGELVLTTLKRLASPLIRYRTGDLVRKKIEQGQLMLPGGILGRCDDMIVVRGVNIYPSALEDILLGHDWIEEFQLQQRRHEQMDEIEIHLEIQNTAADSLEVEKRLLKRLESQLKDTFMLRIPVKTVPSGTLPRAEFKSKRVVKLSS